MWKFYFKSAIRNILKNKWISLINIVGLAIGIASSILIGLWVQDELSFDRFFDNNDRIYKIITEESWSGGDDCFDVTTLPVLPYVLEKYPDIETGTRKLHLLCNVEYNEKAVSVPRTFAVDSMFFSVFSFELLSGNKEKPFTDNSSAVITEQTANIFFEDEDPIGKVIIVNGNLQYKISAVVKEKKQNTSIRFGLLLPYDFAEAMGYDLQSWDRYSTDTYLLLAKNTKPKEVQEKIKNVYLDNRNPEEEADNTKRYIKFQSLKDEHLYEPSGKMGKMVNVYVFSIMAIIILIIACINFMNLSTAQSTKRAKEVGLKKVVGAQRKQLIQQFFLESLIQVVIAFHIAIVIIELLRPEFNIITNKDISLNYFKPEYLIISSIIIIVTSILAGSYPSFLLSSFKPVKVLKGINISENRNISLRKALIIFQFFISSALIIGSFLIYSQLKYINEKDIGIYKENIIHFKTNNQIDNNYEYFKEKLKSNSAITNVTRTFQMPSFYGIGMGAQWEGMDDYISFDVGIADDEHLGTFGIQLLEGRNFDYDLVSDSTAVIINETAAKLFGDENIIGKKMDLLEDGIIIGIVKDYHYQPLKNPIQPMALFNDEEKFEKIAVRYKEGTMESSIEHIENIYQEFCPNYTFDYYEFKDELDYFYREENRLVKIIGYFTFLGILISCLGLLGLSSFSVQQRTKELGIRKVNGATVWDLFDLLNKDFLKLVAIGFILSCPLTWYVINAWMSNFAYKTNISIWYFVIAGFISLFISLITISIHTYRASLQNPVESLRYE